MLLECHGQIVHLNSSLFGSLFKRLVELPDVHCAEQHLGFSLLVVVSVVFREGSLFASAAADCAHG